MTKEQYHAYLKTPEWRRVADMAKKRDGYRCVCCNSKHNLNAHHRTYDHVGNEQSHLGDLTTLCENCHHRHHFPPKFPEPKVIIKKVVEYRDRVITGPKQFWKTLSPEERKFYRGAATLLCRKARKLAILGREAVEAMIRKKGEPVPVFKPEEPAHPKLDGYYLVGDITSVEADMPEGEEILLTRPILNKCRANGAFTTATMKAFGLKASELVHGWASELIGKTYPRATIYAAMRGRHLYATMSFKRTERKRAA